ncbi:Structural maintenance of chromosomes protein 1 [Malassezia sp. CBS 17886]|nr:Structural maintenance of chromosomes protein 1 [Malassezia sp. CBS 17886]
MPLKQLEVENFKSYRGRQTIGPFFAFSAVIGPNGSGKSNLMDAISFVLGVRSAQLRSSQMKDLVFRANSLRMGDGSSVGEDEDDAPDRASVTAVVVDAKKAEHRFQRTILPSGGTEYRYNARVVSQTLYNTRLEQLNILVKARNFLVFQGDVEAVAEQCSRDLSQLIDQISGSHALREEHDALRAAYDEVVERSSALVAKRKALHAEVRQFRERKEVSDRFTSLKSDLLSHTVQHLLWRLYHIHEIVEIHTDWIEANAARGEQMRRRLADRERQVADARTAVGLLQQEIMSAEDERKQKLRAIDAKIPEKERLQERIDHAERKRQQAKALYKQVQKDHAAQQEALARLEADTVLVERASQKTKEEQEAALASSPIHLDEADLQTYHDLKSTSNLTAVPERRALEELQRELRSKQSRLDDERDRHAQLDAKLARVDEQMRALEETQGTLAERETASAARLDRARRQLHAVRGQKQQISTREAELNETLTSCYNKLLAMGQDLRMHEREGRLRETLRTLHTIFPGVHGRLVDLCSPTQRKYELALTTALGRNAEAVVVNHEKTAMECIEYLRNQRVGQATFIPLDTIQVKPTHDRLRTLSQYARLAIDICQYSPAVERAVQYACGNALVCDSLGVARHLCYERGQRVKAVTLEGTVIHKTGMITGGPSMQENVHRWSDQEMHGVQRERDRCMTALRELHQEKYDLGDEDDLAVDIAHVEQELQTTQTEKGDAARRMRDLEKERDALVLDRDSAARAAEELVASVAALAAETASHEATINSATDAVFGAFCARIGVANVREYEAHQLRITEALGLATQQHQRQLARLANQQTFTRQQIDSTAERMAFLQATVARETERLPQFAAEMEESEREVANMRSALGALQTRLAALRETHQAKLDALAEKRRVLATTSRDVDAFRKEVGTRNDEIEQLDAERAAIYRRCRLEAIDLPLQTGSLADVPLEDTGVGVVDADETDSAHARPSRDFGIQLDFARLSDTERTDRSSAKGRALQERVDLTHEELAKLAPSGRADSRLDALERDLKACDRDLDQVRVQVQETREEFHLVKKRRVDLFMRSYNHIAGRIDGIYKDLTKGNAAPMGGVAYLTLEDTDEPYRTGIRFHAMPPMKRFRDMDQLSGGEKTIAALALLFAIHSYHPAPFFVLDEVDAALDSQNVARVSNYIREHASDMFQFIVISLKASLYERSQALLGVYRNPDANSSACITLDLEKYRS